MRQRYKIIFLNPKAHHVFQTTAYDLAGVWSPAVIWTEVSQIVQFHTNKDLIVKDVPRWVYYNRKNYMTRLFSFMSYIFYVFTRVLFHSPQSLLFIVTTPPFLGLIGYLFKKLRNQKYVMLVYDIFPEVLIGAGLMKEGLSAQIWRKFNRIVLGNADAVITIGEYMAENLAMEYCVEKTTLGHIAVIHNWADIECVKPLPKEENSFIRQQGLQDKFVVMYSGNIGATHDVETLVEAVKTLKDNQDIKFVVIGDGAKKQYIVDAKEKYALDNMLILSYLPQDQLSYSLPSADIAVVTIENGVEGYLVPCKFYSYLAAGNAVIAICNAKCEIADIIQNEQCGRVVALGDHASLVKSIIYYYENKSSLNQAKANSRNAAVQKYSRQNTNLYIDVVKKILVKIEKTS
jgi:glycosyltransferase involved in cell wall biosynthesis